ncbi:MAG: hypothetical protein ACRC3H_12225 [Lachnospiraceae bacterium]
MNRTITHHEAVKDFASMFSLPHVFRQLPKCLRSLYGIHQFFKRIEAGEIISAGMYIDEVIHGLAWGIIQGELLEIHVCFDRKVDTERAGELLDVILWEYPKIQVVEGYIPVANRAAGRFAKRHGFKFIETIIIDNTPCGVYRKEV